MNGITSYNEGTAAKDPHFWAEGRKDGVKPLPLASRSPEPVSSPLMVEAM
jgi:hypothetical protein